jgi:hypothetical protein
MISSEPECHYGTAMLKFLKYWLWDVDQLPDRIGLIGFAILGIFLLFCMSCGFTAHPAAK